MFGFRTLLALAGVLALAGGAQAQTAPAGTTFGHYEPAAQFDGEVTTSLYLPMRDGVRLAVSVTRPATGGKAIEGRFPVIWQHTLGIAGAGARGGAGLRGKRRGGGGAREVDRQRVVVARRVGQGTEVHRGGEDRRAARDAVDARPGSRRG